MDEFGVLTQRYGLKPQGKSAPMAASRRSPANLNSQTLNFAPSPKSDDHFGGLGDHLDDLLVGGPTKPPAYHNGALPFDYDSIFSPGTKPDDDDIFGLSKSTAKSNGNGFTSFPSPPPPPPPGRGSPVGDLLGGYHQNEDDIFSAMGAESRTPPGRNGSVLSASNSAGSEDLIPGFGETIRPPRNGSINRPQPSTPNSTLSEDPFSILEPTAKPPRTSPGLSADPLEEFGQFSSAERATDDPVKSPPSSSLDELEEFARGRPSKNEQLKFPSVVKKPPITTRRSQPREGANVPWENKPKSGDDLESFFSVNPRSNSAPKSRTTSSSHENGDRGRSQSKPSGNPSSIKKASSATNIFDDFSSMFGDASVFGEFEEVEGESEERRRARLGRQTRTQQRVAKAVAEMNQRDYQTQKEQEERHRIAENLDADLKRWAAGKEGNMRALLSSLQYVLWPECGWDAVSLTDLITSGAVKKVYRKATLCVHPDKVQQKGATIQQKYIAEKVFDILKEAWKKFEAEELR